jgi:exodeoxyribonuclease V beta subunit
MLEAYRGDIQTLELPSEFDELSKIVAEVNDLPDIRVLLLQHAAYHVGQGLAELKRRSRSFSFSDMTERLGAALRGPRAEQLRAGMLRQFPVILIDEFQDTSPSQYRLFDSLYRTADNHRETALILIGDPKQSIYAFRGADIYSYLKARHATEGRHYALAINHRSTFEMVAAVNAWFALAESRSDAAADARHAAGAFRMRGPDTQPMPFTRVAARGRAEHFQSARGREPALTIAHDLEPRSRDDIKRRYADLCAERIVLWLNDEQAGFKTPEKSFTRLRPSDIAVLVKTRFEAAAVRTALRERGVASVFQSDRESIFASDEAEDLLRWLRAFASPGDSGLVRAALATRTLGFGVEALEAVIRDDDAFDALAETFKEINEVWRQRGVLATIRRSLHAWDLPARWLEHHDGERRLTNVLHLAELLQQASVELDGEQSLIRWLAQQIEADLATEAEEQVLRLESDADLIQIVTVHKSKGLEYPVVCLPFSSLVKRLDPKLTRFIDVVDDSGDRAIQLDFDASDFATADLERQREELRLFYVALTRAQHAVWMGFSCLGVGKALECTTHFSAPGYLLGGPEPRRAPEWLEALNALAHLAPPASIECVAASAERSSLSQLNRAEVKAPLAAPLLFDQVIERDWRAGSFTYLIRNMADTLLAATLRHRPADDERQAPGVSTESDSSAASSSAGLPVTGPEVAHSQPESAPPWPQTAAIRLETAAWHRFPPGARSGDFIHGVLEAVAEEGFQLSGHSRLRELILDRCDRHGHADRADDVLGWMQALTDTRLPSLGARLAEVRHSLSEMEFWMPAHRLRADRIDALCREHLLRGRARPELPEKGLNGMLMGFADLVFEHGGRYWVLDYKTNRLSIDSDLERAYDTESLEAEMARHRYDVQAALYLLALHRQLRTRLRHRYDPEKHLGGALYWFVRGLEGPVRGEYAVLMDDSLLTLIDALDRMLSGEGERL